MKPDVIDQAMDVDQLTGLFKPLHVGHERGAGTQSHLEALYDRHVGHGVVAKIIGVDDQHAITTIMG